MSYSWRDRLRIRLKQKKIELTTEELEHLEKFIEQYCFESDQRCKAIDPNKAVDLVIDEMSDEEFDKFTKALIKDVTARIKQSQKKKKKKKAKKLVKKNGYSVMEEETPKEEEKEVEVEAQ